MLLLFLIASLLLTADSIVCNVGRQGNVESNCTGDMCASVFVSGEQIWEQGCVTATPYSRDFNGCYGQDEAGKSCFCRSADYCNDDVRIRTKVHVDQPMTCYKNSSKQCEGVACILSEFETIAGYNCQTTDRVMGTFYGLFPNIIFVDSSLGPNYKTKRLENAISLDAQCLNENCVALFDKIRANNKTITSNRRQIKCYAVMVYDTENTNYLCSGDFCYLSDSSRGCLSVDDSLADWKLRAGVYTYLSVTVSICDEALCNWNETTSLANIAGAPVVENEGPLPGVTLPRNPEWDKFCFTLSTQMPANCTGDMCAMSIVDDNQIQAQGCASITPFTQNLNGCYGAGVVRTCFCRSDHCNGKKQRSTKVFVDKQIACFENTTDQCSGIGCDISEFSTTLTTRVHYNCQSIYRTVYAFYTLFPNNIFIDYRLAPCYKTKMLEYEIKTNALCLTEDCVSLTVKIRGNKDLVSNRTQIKCYAVADDVDEYKEYLCSGHFCYFQDGFRGCIRVDDTLSEWKIQVGTYSYFMYLSTVYFCDEPLCNWNETTALANIEGDLEVENKGPAFDTGAEKP